MDKKNEYGKIYITYHKPWVLLNEPCIENINAGRACIDESKDGNLSEKDKLWLKNNTLGDNIGKNISDRNREYCECTALYWIWKNINYGKLKYIGCQQYRRQLILNEYYTKAKCDKEKKIYKCIHFKKKNNIPATIGLTENNVLNLLKQFDYIIPYETDLKEMDINNIYEDWVKKIPGVHIDDLLILENYFCNKYPDEAENFRKYLESPKKRMYQIFIMKAELFDDYCKWLFEILFEIDRRIDTQLYTINGKRTIGYLAEVLYGYYFYKISLQKKDNVLECGVTYIE